MDSGSKPFGLRGFMRAGDAPRRGAVDRNDCWSRCSEVDYLINWGEPE